MASLAPLVAQIGVAVPHQEEHVEGEGEERRAWEHTNTHNQQMHFQQKKKEKSQSVYGQRPVNRCLPALRDGVMPIQDTVPKNVQTHA